MSFAKRMYATPNASLAGIKYGVRLEIAASERLAAHKNRKAECPVFSLSAIAEPLKGGFCYL